MLPAYAPYNANTNDQGFASVSSPVVGSDSEFNGPQSSRLNAAEPAVNRTAKAGLMPLSQSAVLLLLNQLAVMSQNGIEIADALESLSKHCSDQRLAGSLAAIHEAVSSGDTFSHAVAVHGHHFPSTLAPMLAAAEATGQVPETLGRICQRMRGELQMRGTIIGALIYPFILIGASSIVMAALIMGVLPQFSQVFASMGKPVPAYTRALLSLGDFCRAHWYLILPAIGLLAAGAIALRRHPIIRRPIGRFLMYGPLIRDAYRPLQAGRNLRTLAAMVQGGVPMLQAVQLARGTTGDVYWQGLLQAIEERLIDGMPASSAMLGIDFLPPETAQLMATSERTGRIAEVLEDIGEFYEEEAGRRIKRLVVALEPAIILVMGVIVAAIVMSVMLPLLDVSTIQS